MCGLRIYYTDTKFYSFIIIMKIKFYLYLILWLFSLIIWFWWLQWGVYAQRSMTPEKVCSWIKLNTNFPIIWNCIETHSWSETNPTNAFPKMISALIKIVMSLILVVCFILIIYAGIQWASDNPWSWKWWWAKWTLTKVAITILVLWFSWVILRLINPNFFG